jgi:hypothetical protein
MIGMRRVPHVRPPPQRRHANGGPQHRLGASRHLQPPRVASTGMAGLTHRIGAVERGPRTYSHGAWSQLVKTARCSAVAAGLRRILYTFGGAAVTGTETVSSRPRRNTWSTTGVPGA